MRYIVSALRWVLPVLAYAGATGTTWAVGDLPVELNKREATAYYISIRPFLENDGLTCPVGQEPISGLISGGSAPSFGTQSILIQFNKGGVVRIVKHWNRSNRGMSTPSAEITCS